jgi:AcrR family transcriptional regulator
MPKAEQARDGILEAAKQLFLANGYGAIGMREIAKAAGYKSVAGIYNHFESKDAIFRALIEERTPIADLIAVVERVEGDTAPSFIENLVKTILPIMQRHVEFFDLAQIDLREFGGANTQRLILEELLPHALKITQKLQTLPRVAIQDPLVLLRLLISVLLGYVITQRLAPEILTHHISDEAWIEAYTGMLIEGLCKTKQE